MDMLTLVFGVVGRALGLAFACAVLAIAAAAAEDNGADTISPRAILGLGLALLAFTCRFIPPLFTGWR
jgi:hypothetical protein